MTPDTATDQEAIWRGPQLLRQFLVPIKDLTPHPDNARQGDARMVADSLDRFGQLKTIVLHTYTRDELHGQTVIVAGHHTMYAARSLGWTHIAAVNDPELTDEQADQFLLMDNRSSDTATYDDAKLVELLERHQQDGTLDGTGYTPDDLDDIVAAVTGAAQTAAEDFTGGYGETDEEAAARVAGRNEGQVRELGLPVPAEHYDEFLQLVALMKQAYEQQTAALALLYAMREIRQRAEKDGDLT